MKKHLFFLAAAFAFSASAARAESQWRVPVDFAWTNDATAGYSMFLIGSHPDVGGWDYLHSIPLAWHEGNVWSATVGIQAGTDLEYKFIRRPTDNQGILSKPEDWDWFPSGPNLSTNIPAEANPPFSGKTALFLCPWDEPVRIHWSRLSTPDYNATNSWTNATMTKLASGRYITTFDEPDPDKPSIRGEWIRFTFSGYEDGKEKWYHFYGTEGTDHEEDLFSPLDAFCVRDGQVFDYEPAVNSEGYVSNSRFEERDVYPWPVDETQGVSNRTIRIYLPRGYNENTNRSYPVLYFADGQNIFSDQHSSADAWGVDTAADREIRGGRMREAILVGVPCRETPPPGASPDYTWAGRLWEYLPGTDNLYMSQQLLGYALQGNGFHYMNFLLGNVVPTLDYNYRTLRDSANTGHVGSSAGGLLSFWLGAYTNRFGLIGAVSGVYNQEYIPAFREWCGNHIGELGTNKIKRIWLDTGTEETDVMGLNLYESNWNALTLLLYAGQIQNKTLHFGIYTGAYGQHNEYAWAARSADILRFLLPVTDEFNPLLPIELKLQDGAITYPLYPDTANELVHLDSLLPLHTNKVTSLGEPTEKPWDAGTFVPEDAGFYFIRAKGSH